MKFLEKIYSRDVLVGVSAKLSAAGKLVGYTSGTFDLLHSGHVEYLEAAKAACDILIAGINSDQSVKKYKDPTRPINNELKRAQVIAGLASVDYVFVFDELNNNRNIELLKPNLYIKAGDYSREKLSSASIVESYGGKVLLVPFKEGESSTSIIDRIKDSVLSSSIELPRSGPRPTVFVDRDGTIIELVEYLHEASKVKLLPGAAEGLKALKEYGFLIVIITNQPGIGLGYFTKEDLFVVNRQMLRELNAHGVEINKLYFCPHNVSEHCLCRKPGTALVDRAVQELSIDLKKSFVVGDTDLDIKLAKNVGVRSVFVGALIPKEVTPDFCASSLTQAAQWIIGNS